MKKLILAGFFLVTWSQYSMHISTWISDDPKLCFPTDDAVYEVSLSTESRRFATQKDVDLAVGRPCKIWDNDATFREDYCGGKFLEPHMFNVRVQEVK